MNIKLGTIALVGGAFFAGYSKGLKDGGNINAGLQSVGKGLQDLAVQIGVEARMNMERDEEIRKLTEEQKHEVWLLAQGGQRTDAQIAHQTGISEAAVRKILMDKKDDVPEAEVVEDEKDAEKAFDPYIPGTDVRESAVRNFNEGVSPTKTNFEIAENLGIRIEDVDRILGDDDSMPEPPAETQAT